MTFPKAFLVRLGLFSLSLPAVFAAPVDIDEAFFDKSIVKRDGQDRDHPIASDFDITGWEDIAEQDCYAMLCLNNANRVYQRAETRNEVNTHRTESGVNLQPFTSDELGTRHTTQINPQTVSAEEFPWASTNNGGANAYVFPATIAQQDKQKTAISAGYRRNPRIGYGDWFEITFTGNLGPYCRALHANPPDRSICRNNYQSTLFGTVGVLLAQFAYQIVTSNGQPYTFKHVGGGKRSEEYAPVVREVNDVAVEFARDLNIESAQIARDLNEKTVHFVREIDDNQAQVPRDFVDDFTD